MRNAKKHIARLLLSPSAVSEVDIHHLVVVQPKRTTLPRRQEDRVMFACTFSSNSTSVTWVKVQKRGLHFHFLYRCFGGESKVTLPGCRAPRCLIKWFHWTGFLPVHTAHYAFLPNMTRVRVRTTSDNRHTEASFTTGDLPQGSFDAWFAHFGLGAMLAT